MPAQLNQLTIDGLTARWQKNYAPATAYTRAGILRRILKLLTQHGALALTVHRFKPGKPRPRIATQKEIDALLARAPAHLRLFILLCWQTGLRHSEALAVTPQSFNRENKTVTIRVKGGAHRTIPVTAPIATLIEAAAEVSGTEGCVQSLRGRTLSRASMYSSWANLCRKAGITNLHPHDLRRTVLTELYRRTHDLRAVQQYAGHENLQSTLHYLAPLHEEQLREYQRLLEFHSELKQ